MDNHNRIMSLKTNRNAENIQQALRELPPIVLANDPNGYSHRITDAKVEDNVLYGYHPKTGLWFPVVSYKTCRPHGPTDN